MLLLTRKEGESLIIEVEGLKEPIELKIVEFKFLILQLFMDKKKVM
jgi:sRNA-binding carbon storage regulator CsrA